MQQLILVIGHGEVEMITFLWSTELTPFKGTSHHSVEYRCSNLSQARKGFLATSPSLIHGNVKYCLYIISLLSYIISINFILRLFFLNQTTQTELNSMVVFHCIFFDIYLLFLTFFYASIESVLQKILFLLHHMRNVT